MQGYAFQCRVTTEDPANKFTPDYGRITHYRSAGGMGIRLDGGPAITGGDHHAVLRLAAGEDRRPTAGGSSTPPGAWSAASRSSGSAASRRTSRSCSTWSTHPEFLAGDCTTRFIDETPELFRFPVRQDRATQAADLIAEIIVNGLPGRQPGRSRPTCGAEPSPPPSCTTADAARRRASRQQFQRAGPGDVRRAGCCEQKPLLVTDTTFRDAHQSLLATRVRTRDMLRVADALRGPLCPGSSRSRCGAAPPSTRPCGS